MMEDALLFMLRNKDCEEVAEIPAESFNSTYTVVAFALNNG